jgi:hypothetical protein
MIITETAKIFVLEDSPERIAWFGQRVPQATFASNAEPALTLLFAVRLRRVRRL